MPFYSRLTKNSLRHIHIQNDNEIFYSDADIREYSPLFGWYIVFQLTIFQLSVYAKCDAYLIVVFVLYSSFYYNKQSYSLCHSMMTLTVYSSIYHILYAYTKNNNCQSKTKSLFCHLFSILLCDEQTNSSIYIYSCFKCDICIFVYTYIYILHIVHKHIQTDTKPLKYRKYNTNNMAMA